MKNVTLLRVAILLLGLSITFALQVEVDPHREQCFWDDIEEDTYVEFHFQVISGGKLDIDVKVHCFRFELF